MSNDANLSGFQKDRYFGRAWAMLTREKGWWKPVLLCALGALVPIVGPLAVLGYGLEWSRRVAWGSTEGPSRQVKIGGLIKSGWRGFVVVAGWSIIAGVVGTIVGNLPWIGRSPGQRLVDFLALPQRGLPCRRGPRDDLSEL